MLEVAADRSKRWRFGVVYASSLSPLIVLFVGIGFGIGELSREGAVWVALLSIACACIYGLGFCLVWLRTASRTTYRVIGSRFEVDRAGRVLRSFEISSIRHFEFMNTMDTRSILTDVAPPPEWPAGMLTIDDGQGERVEILPEIMIWGRQPRREAESALRIAIRSAGGRA